MATWKREGLAQLMYVRIHSAHTTHPCKGSARKKVDPM